MRKAVLISIQPKWCELIASGKKTVEVRKSRPKIDTPFKCYIYCTNNQVFAQSSMEGEYFTSPKSGLRELECCGSKILSGKVIGEFVCDDITKFAIDPKYDNLTLMSMANRSCLSKPQLEDYCSDYWLYGWHISDLKIYDKPKELCEFRKPCIYPKMPYCPTCPVGYEYISETEEEFYVCDGECNTEWVCQNYLKKAPQSWCYVEEDTENA